MKKKATFLLAVMLCLMSALALADRVVVEREQVNVICEGLKPETEYSFIVSTAEAPGQAVADGTLLYADQMKANAEGTINVAFIRADLPDCFFFMGGDFSAVSPETASPRRIGVYTAAGDAPASFAQDLKTIEEEAFMGCAFQYVVLGEQVEAIGAGAFRDCAELRRITIPDSVTEIAEDAFEGCVNLTIECGADSVAYKYAADHGMMIAIR